MCCESLRPSFKCQFHPGCTFFIKFSSPFLWPTKTFQTSKEYLIDKLNKDLFNRKIWTNGSSDIKKQISSEMKFIVLNLNVLNMIHYLYLTGVI